MINKSTVFLALCIIVATCAGQRSPVTLIDHIQQEDKAVYAENAPTSISPLSIPRTVTSRMLTVSNIRGYPEKRFKGWNGWKGGRWNWQHQMHRYPYYYYRYYPYQSHYYAYIPYYDYQYQPFYEYPNTSMALEQQRIVHELKKLTHSLDLYTAALATTTDDDRRLELERAIRQHLIVFDRFNTELKKINELLS